jgi:hypothetical protein
MSFINEIFKNSRFLSEGVKINFENTKRASDVTELSKRVSPFGKGVP